MLKRLYIEKNGIEVSYRSFMGLKIGLEIVVDGRRAWPLP